MQASQEGESEATLTLYVGHNQCYRIGNNNDCVNGTDYGEHKKSGMTTLLLCSTCVSLGLYAQFWPSDSCASCLRNDLRNDDKARSGLIMGSLLSTVNFALDFQIAYYSVPKTSSLTDVPSDT